MNSEKYILETRMLRLKKLPKKNAVPYEDQEQLLAVKWLARNDIPFYFIPNGGKRNLLEAIKFKSLGVKAGIPDLCIPVAKQNFHGLYIELKRRKGGKVSKSQHYWLQQLVYQGYDCFVAMGADDLIAYVKNYMGIQDEQNKAKS